MSKIIVITGASRGLGRALVDAFVAAGHVVAGCGRTAAAVAELQNRYPSPHRFATVDVSDAAAVQAWAEDVLKNVGTPDLLINNAAIMTPPAPLWQVKREDFHAAVQINICGVFHVIQAFVPAMVERRQGVIVNLSSAWGRSTSPRVATYCATKYAIEGLTLALAQELPKGMAAVPLNPGIIDTDMLRSVWPTAAAKYPSPEKWAQKAAPFLLQLSAEHNGKSLTVPGSAA